LRGVSPMMASPLALQLPSPALLPSGLGSAAAAAADGHRQRLRAVLTPPSASPLRSGDARSSICLFALAGTISAGLTAAAAHRRAERRRRRAGAVACAAVDAGRVISAIGLARDYQKKRQTGKMSRVQDRKLRMLEIQNKINVLKGRSSRTDKYKTERDRERAEAARAANQVNLPAAVREEEGEQDDEGEEEEGGEGPATWSWIRKGEVVEASVERGEISDEARAIANTALNGSGLASAQQLIDTATEFEFAAEWEDAADLLELARKRIDKEQLGGSLTNDQAKQLDDEVLWQLAHVYEEDRRLIDAADRYSLLKDKTWDKNSQREVTRAWGECCYKLAEALQECQRGKEAIVVMQAVKDQTTKAAVGESLWEQLDLLLAITYDNIGQKDDAKTVLINLVSSSTDKTKKSKALFMLDVFSVELSSERNTALHDIFDQSFQLPRGSFRPSGQVNLGGGRRLSISNLSPREREWRDWTSQYWEDRMKSPIYYACLILWVTWPFAIPIKAFIDKGWINLNWIPFLH